MNALLFLLSAAATGQSAVWIARRLFPAASRGERAAAATVIATAIGTDLLSILGAVGWMRPWPVAVGCVLVAVAARAARAPAGRGDAEAPGIGACLAYVPLLVPIGLAAPYLGRAVAAPPRAWDALTYHLTRAADWVQDGGFISHPAPDAWRYYEFFPHAGDLLFAFTFLAGHGDALLFLAFGSVVAAVLLGAFALARALGAAPFEAALAAAVAGTTPCVLHFVAVPYVDNAWLALVVLGGAHAARAVRAERADAALAVAMLAVGTAAATKTSGWFFVLAVALLAAVLVVRGRASAAVQIPVFVASLVPAGVWALHVWGCTGSPLYPLSLRLGGWVLAEGNELFRVTHDGTLTAGVSAVPSAAVFLRELFVGSRYAEWPHLNFGFGIALALPLGAVGVVRGRVVPRWFALLLVAVALLPLAGLFSSSMTLERSVWSPVSGRLVSPIAVVAVALAAAPSGWLARAGLAACLLASLATARPVGLPIVDLATGAAAIAIGMAWTAALLVPFVAARRGPWRAALCGAVLLATPWCLDRLDGRRAAHRYDYFAGMARGESYDLHPVPIGDQYLVWQRLDGDRPQRIAFSAGFDQGGHNWFRYPLYGSRLQNRVRYVPATRDGEVVDTWRPPAAGPAALDADVYADRLLREGVEWVVLVQPAGPDADVALARRDRFEVVFAAPSGSIVLLRPRAR